MKYLIVRNSPNSAEVDDEDYARLLDYDWFINNTRSSILAYHHSRNGKSVCECLSNVVMNKFDVLFDHKDRDPFNNQKSNLRECTHQQNCFNSTKREGCSSKYKGVYWFKKTKKWCARLHFSGKVYCLGYFDKEEDAALAYNNKAIEIFKEFANLNKI